MSFYGSPATTPLINTLSQRSPYEVSPSQQLLYSVFPFLPRPQVFHCISFYRTRQSTLDFDPLAEMEFADGRKFLITTVEFKPCFFYEVETRCCIDAIEATTGEFVPVEVWFHKTSYADGRFTPEDKRAMIEIARHQVYDFLHGIHSPMDWSRCGRPYVLEIK